MVLRLRGTEVTALQGNMSPQGNSQLKSSPACNPLRQELRLTESLGNLVEYPQKSQSSISLAPYKTLMVLTCKPIANKPPMPEAHKNYPFVLAWTLKVNPIPDKLSFPYFPAAVAIYFSAAFYQLFPTNPSIFSHFTPHLPFASSFIPPSIPEASCSYPLLSTQFKCFPKLELALGQLGQIQMLWCFCGIWLPGSHLGSFLLPGP